MGEKWAHNKSSCWKSFREAPPWSVLQPRGWRNRGQREEQYERHITTHTRWDTIVFMGFCLKAKTHELSILARSFMPCHNQISIIFRCLRRKKRQSWRGGCRMIPSVEAGAEPASWAKVLKGEIIMMMMVVWRTNDIFPSRWIFVLLCVSCRSYTFCEVEFKYTFFADCILLVSIIRFIFFVRLGLNILSWTQVGLWQRLWPTLQRASWPLLQYWRRWGWAKIPWRWFLKIVSIALFQHLYCCGEKNAYAFTMLSEAQLRNMSISWP